MYDVGIIGEPATEMAHTMLKAAVEFLNENQQTKLVRIDVVIFQSHMVKEFVGSMEAAIGKKRSLFKRFKVYISSWVSSLWEEPDYGKNI